MQLMIHRTLRFFKNPTQSYSTYQNYKIADLAARKTAPLVEQLVHAPFTQAMIHDCLSKEALSNFIEQEEYFLAQYADAKAIISSKLPIQYGKRFQSSNRQTSANERALLNQLKEKFAIKHFTGTIDPCTQAYGDYLIQTAQHAPICYAIAATLPCYTTYLKLSELINQQMTADHPYFAWANHYVTPSFRQATERQVHLFNELGKESPQKIAGMIEHYEQSVQFEVAFRDALLPDYEVKVRSKARCA